MSTNKAAEQILDWAEKNKKNQERLTTGHGQPIGDKFNSLTAGPLGPILLQDTNLIDELAHFDRERIPERVVHAKGAGAFGYFECTHDITQYTKAAPFAQVGKRTPVAARFSTVGGESGSADTARDPRGFAVKFYTEDGIWDIVGNSTPIFFIRDPIHFPSFIHTQKRNPVTNLKDATMFWDFITLRPETCHQVAFLFSDRGTPDGYRHMNGYGSHTFKFVNAQNESTYVKFHFKTDQGIKNMTNQQAVKLAGENPDYSTQDLYNSIANGNLPSWTFKIQVMSEKQAAKVDFNPFDLTKVWPQGEYPMMPAGKLVLDRNPTNYFAQVEQIAFAPSHLIPGIEVSPDKMLHGRLFSYADTHRHRLGPNYLQIPVNCPFKVRNAQRDGAQQVGDNQTGAPNYFPNSFSGVTTNYQYKERPAAIPAGTNTDQVLADRYETKDEDNFTQAGVFWRTTLKEEERIRLIENMSSHLIDAAEFIQERAVKLFGQVDADFGQRLNTALLTLCASRK